MCETIIEICSEYDWNYILNCKDGRQKTLVQDYAYAIGSGEHGKREKLLGEEKGIAKYVNHVEEISGKSFTANIYEYEYTKEIKGKKTTVRFQWLTVWRNILLSSYPRSITKVALSNIAAPRSMAEKVTSFAEV